MVVVVVAAVQLSWPRLTGTGAAQVALKRRPAYSNECCTVQANTKNRLKNSCTRRVQSSQRSDVSLF